MNRSTILLLALLAVLGAIVYLVLPSDEERMASYTKTPVSFSVDSASVMRVSIERPGKKLVIENVGGRWTITSHGNLPADPSTVTELIGGFSRFRAGSLVSTNPVKQSLFQVDSSGALVTLTERSAATRSIVIGKMGPSFSEVYFRMPGASEVYLGSGITTWSLEREVKDWRDKTIFASPAEAIRGLTVASGGRVRTYSRDSTGWKSGQDPVPTETINPLLTALSNLRAEDFIDSAVQFTGAPSTLEVTGAVNGKLDFYRLGSDTNRYAVQASGNPQKFIIGKYVTSQLFKAVGEPKPSGVVSARRAEPESKVETRSAPPVVTRQPAKAEPVPAETREVTKPQAEPPADTRTQPTAINPFKQKPAGEQRPPAETLTPPAAGQRPKTPPSGGTVKTQTPAVKNPDQTPAKTPARPPVRTGVTPQEKAPAPAQGGADEEGELTVHVIKKGETMTSIAKQYGVTVEQILKWNLLKSISVKPGQELYIFVRK